MERYKPKEVTWAEQWFPGSKTDGVVNDYPDDATHKVLCGCMIIGGPKGAHIHTAPLGSIELAPGDWIVRCGGKWSVLKPEQFQSLYLPDPR